MVTIHDPEHGWSVGTDVDEYRVKEAFEDDVQSVLSDCEKLYVQWEHLPEEAQQVIANMMFNMGRTRLGKFKNMNAAVEEGDYSRAANEMVNSRWYNQTSGDTNSSINYVSLGCNLKISSIAY